MSNSKSVYVLFEQLMDFDSIVGLFKRLDAAKYAAEYARREKGLSADGEWVEQYEGVFHRLHGTEYFIRKHDLQ